MAQIIEKESLDRGLAYGDGLFTTLSVVQGKAKAVPLHLKRLQDGACRLGIEFDDWQTLAQRINELAAQSAAPSVIRVTLSRGRGGRGYAPIDCHPTVYLSTSNAPSHYPKWQQIGVNVGISDVVISRQPRLAGVKNLNRLENVLAKNHPSEFDDMLMFDEFGHLICATSSNIALVKGQQILLPSHGHSGIAGTKRFELIQFAMDNNLNVQACLLKRQHLAECDAILLLNSLMGAVWVKDVVGVTTQRLSPPNWLESFNQL